MSWLAARSWRFWTTFASLLPVVYAASLGPTLLLDLDGMPDWERDAFATFYEPLEWCVNRTPDWLGIWYGRYLNFWRGLIGKGITE